MNIVILGASGFIGRHLFEFYADNPNVNLKGIYFTNNSELLRFDKRFVKADLRNISNIKSVIRGADVVIQAAASTTGINDAIKNPSVHVTDNVIMNSLLLREAASQKVSKFIFLSCTVMYQKEKYPQRFEAVSEVDDNLNDEIYHTYVGAGWTKVYIEKMCKFYSNNSNLITHCLRHSNVYGPWDKFDPFRSHVIGATIRKVLLPTDEQILVWGDGSEFRDFLYISDLVTAISKFIGLETKENFNIWNIGSGVGIKILDLVKIIRKISHKEHREIFFDHTKPTAKTGVILNCEKFFKASGWMPQVSLEAGLETTIKWYLANFQSLNNAKHQKHS
jgi:GDP-L-fucose synthase